MNDSSQHSPAPRVLLLDDNLFSSSRIVRSLQQQGCVVTTTLDASTCSGEFDIILLNLGSRSLGGAAQISPLRAQFAAAQIIGFCGHLEIEIRREAKAAGIDRLLTNDQVFNGTDWL